MDNIPFQVIFYAVCSFEQAAFLLLASGFNAPLPAAGKFIFKGIGDQKSRYQSRPPEDRRRKDGFAMKKTSKNNTRNIIISIAALIVLAALFFTAYQLLRPRGAEGNKKIHFTVLVNNETIKSYDFRTDAEYLRQALEEENLIEGDEGTYGLWVTTVAGRKADSGKEEWWALYKNDKLSMTGVDDTPLEDNDSIEYRLTVGYDDAD